MEEPIMMFKLLKTSSAVFGKATGVVATTLVGSVIRTNGMKTRIANNIEDLRDTVTNGDLVDFQRSLRTQVTLSKKEKQNKKDAKAKAKGSSEEVKETTDAKEQSETAEKASDKKSKKAA